MKYAALMLVVLIVAGCTTTGAVPENERFYQQVLDTPGDKDTLYRLANEWMVEMFVSAEAVIQYQDKAEGVLKGKGEARTRSRGDVAFTLTIEMKDGKTRITFQNMHHPSTGDRLLDVFVVYDRESQGQFLAWAETAVSSLETYLVADKPEW